MSTNSIAGPSRNILAHYDNIANLEDEDDIPTIQYVHSNIFCAPIIKVSSSDVESLKKGIIKTTKNRANRPHTILLVGETGVGKSSLLEFIGNVLAGNDIDHYNIDILDRTNERGGSKYQSQTSSAHLYEFTSRHGVVVSTCVLNMMSMNNPSLRFASSIHRGLLTPAIVSKTNST